jgi:hypothetical protein
MSSLDEPRRLLPNEKAVVWQILNAHAGPGRRELLDQLHAGPSVSGPVTLLELEVTRSASRASIPDGPIGVRAVVETPEEGLLGEILVWVRDGYLSGLEYAWYTEAPPESFPDPACVTLKAI